ncbi:MAG: hypothetical protein R3C02_01695 [Planctomycetaceae bacterium]
MDEMLVRFLTNIIYYLLLAVVAMAALERFGVETTSSPPSSQLPVLRWEWLLAGVTGELRCRVMLIVSGPFKMGDFVEAGRHGYG